MYAHVVANSMNATHQQSQSREFYDSSGIITIICYTCWNNNWSQTLI